MQERKDAFREVLPKQGTGGGRAPAAGAAWPRRSRKALLSPCRAAVGGGHGLHGAVQAQGAAAQVGDAGEAGEAAAGGAGGGAAARGDTAAPALAPGRDCPCDGDRPRTGVLLGGGAGRREAPFLAFSSKSSTCRFQGDVSKCL